MTNNKLNVSQVSAMIGTSVQTIGSWYKFKRENPEDELSLMLPDFERIGNRKTRYWNKDDIWKLIEFKANMVHGRYGKLGSVTQRYCKDNFRNKQKEEN